jgi:hypothetical protein
MRARFLSAGSTRPRMEINPGSVLCVAQGFAFAGSAVWSSAEPGAITCNAGIFSIAGHRAPE